ncbi:MAG: hypothetical protein S4CHLAM123_06630 [Chlamydiales bacterium]|nr:hypothetical protein [Chlamydiales bacterium]
MKKFLVLLLVLGSLCAQEESLDIQLSTAPEMEAQESFFLTSTDYKIAPKVNPVTGEYCEEEVDLVVAGVEPLSVRRFYNHLAPYDPRTAGWRYNPEAFCAANFEWKEKDLFAAFGERDGSVCSLKSSGKKTCRFHFELSEEFTAGVASGQEHPLNLKLSYWKLRDPKNKHNFQYMVTAQDGSGRIRELHTRRHRWLTPIHYTKKTGSWFWGASQRWEIMPNSWTPFQVEVSEERLPNGNVLSYEYTEWKKEEEGFPFPALLQSITAYNRDKTKILGSLHFNYPRIKHQDVGGVEVTGSDARRMFIQHAGKKPIVLASAYRPNLPTVHHGHWKNDIICRIEKGDGRVLETSYDPDTKKVSVQCASVGPNGEMCPIGTYFYEDRSTLVHDAEDNHTRYHFDADKKITALEYCEKDRLHHIDRFNWDPQTGNLLQKTLEDPSGQLLRITDYIYDHNQNLIQERMGDGIEWRTLTRTFSEDGFNLVLSETDRSDKITRYSYIPNTNLLASEFIYHNDTLCQRTFHFYDDCAICIKTITDDGSSEEPYDLQNVTTRKITQITPKQQTPCFGLPEIVEEKTIDSSGQEILLHKVIYTYAPSGQVLQEEHYDANNIYRYTLYSTYDSQEQLLTKTDPLGHITSYTHDTNNNLIAITGPNPHQYKQITYDKANRPTHLIDQQTDGTHLSIQSKYDKLGRVVQTIDACQNATQYTYNFVGQQTAIILPEGSATYKEYDTLGNLIKETDPKGYITQKTYNPFGQVLTVEYPDNTQEAYTYNSTGTIASYLDQNGTTTLYTYDIFDHPTQTEIYAPTGELLKSTITTWTPFHKLSETTGDLTLSYIYDYAGRIIDEQKAYQHTHYTYDSLGRVTQTETGDTLLIQEYDLANNLIETRTAQTQESYIYDSAGNRTHTIGEGITETQYNTHGKPLLQIDPLGHTTHFAYSYADTLIQTITNPKGIQTQTLYDAQNREIQTLKKNTLNQTIQQTTNSYDLNNNCTQTTHTVYSKTEPTQIITHKWTYGPNNRLESLLEAETKETRYLYDNYGRLKTLIKPNKRELSHAYDALGRLSHYSSIDFDYHYTYDQNDRVIEIYDAYTHTTTTRTYDPLGNILQETLANNLTLTFTYDAQGRLITLILPDSSQIDYAYNGNFLSEVHRNGYTHTYTNRNLEGLLTQATLPTNLGQICIDRDLLGRYTNYTSPYFTARYTNYDPNGNLLSYQYQDQYGTVASLYGYDVLDQLIQENEHSYHYDSLSNRLKKDQNTHQVNALCQITHDGQTNYIYDLCGNLLSDETHKYFYDSQDRLISVEKGSKRIQFTYDPFHRRLSKTVYYNEEPIRYLRYLWDGDNEIGVVDETEKIVELRVLGEGLGAEIGAAVLLELNGKAYVPLHDQRGCLVTLIDPEQAIAIESYRYTSFGEELTDTQLSPWRFSSKRTDEETQLVFFGRRYYYPELGRWITQDPEGFHDGPNLYAYLHNGPLLSIDPYGLSFAELIAQFGWGRSGLNTFNAFSWKDYSEFEMVLENKSYNASLGLRELPYGEIGRTNGIFNKAQDVTNTALYLSEAAGGYNIHYTHNQTHGIIDFQEAGMNVYGQIATTPVFKIHERWDRYFETNTLNVPYYEECHSQGASLVKLALERYPKERRDLIQVRAFAPAAYIPKELCMDVVHYVSEGDIVHLLDFKGRRACADTIVELRPKPGASFFLDHSISSPTFAKARRDSVQQYIESLESYIK